MHPLAPEPGWDRVVQVDAGTVGPCQVDRFTCLALDEAPRLSCPQRTVVAQLVELLARSPEVLARD